MKHFNYKTLVLALAGVMGVSSLSAASFSDGQSLFDKQFKTVKSGRKVKNDRAFTPAVLDMDREVAKLANRNRIAGKDADLSFEKLPDWDYILGPNGENWFYIAQYEYVDVVFNEYYTEHLKRAFTMTIYDEGFNVVGTIKDKIHFVEGEGWEGPKDENGNSTWYGRDMESTIDPQITRNFFNTDDKLEVMVFHAMNTPRYVNHYYYDVYQIDGAKDDEGNDVSIANFEGRCVESFRYDDGTGAENYFLTFVLDPVVDWPLDDPNALEKLHQSFFDLTTYSKATSEEGPQVFKKYKIYNTHVPGDTNDCIYFMTKQEGDAMYMIYSQYEKPCLIDPRGGAIDERQTPDNNLVIDVYKSVKGSEPVASSLTKIPVEIVESDEHLMYSFYSIGSLAFTKDVDMRVNGTPDAPAYIVTHIVVAASNLDAPGTSIDLYDAAGKKIRTITQGDGLVVLDYLNGNEPLAVTLTINELNDYIFNFTDLYSGKVRAQISQTNGGDPLFANSFSVLQDGDKFKYVFEMIYLEEDDDYNAISRVAWFDNEGNLDHIDKINMGQGVQQSMVNIYPECLNPKLYDDDDNMEYAVLVKRTQPNGTTRNEFMVVDDDGSVYALFSKDDGKGDPSLFTILPGATNRLMMIYQDDNFKYNVDLFDLPFLPDQKLSGIENIESAGSDAPAVYYDLQGRKVSNPERGIYLKKTGSKVEKILK